MIMHAPPPPSPALWQWLDFLFAAALKVAAIVVIAELVIQGPSFIFGHLIATLATQY